ncbi:hypothetical protein SAMN05443573_12154 [Celeribacter indicus]|nr:hypothetical protein SAMN05443573_12154 [Celeribacter indicus]
MVIAPVSAVAGIMARVVPVTTRPTTVIAVAIITIPGALIVARWLCPPGCGHFDRAALDDLVQLTPVQPDAAALRAIVDLYALAVRHYQIDPAMGTGKTTTAAGGFGCKNRVHVAPIRKSIPVMRAWNSCILQ